MDVNSILDSAIRARATDIIIRSNYPIKYRISGKVQTPNNSPIFQARDMSDLAKSITPTRLLGSLEHTGDVDFSYHHPSGERFRVNLYRQRQAFAIVMRAIPKTIPSLSALNLPGIIRTLPLRRRGLILVTGATGSGKSSTIAAMIDEINKQRPYHIVTIEDPIEFMHSDVRSAISQREIGVDAVSYATALRAALRQNPDVIFVGELRDKETAETLLMAAETGHLVLSTLHTLDALESLNRIIWFFDPHQHKSVRQSLSRTLVAVVSQRLLPRKKSSSLIPAVEVMVADNYVREIIQKGGSLEPILEMINSNNQLEGMQSFDQHLLFLCENGIITVETALAEAAHKENLRIRMMGIKQ